MTKNRIFRSAAAGLLALAMCLAAGCSGGSSGTTDPGGSASGTTGKSGGGKTPSGTPEYVYTADFSKVQSDLSGMDAVQYRDGKLYFMSYAKLGEEEPGEDDPKPGDEAYYEGMYDIWGSSFYALDLDTKQVTKLENYTEPELEDEGYSSVNDFIVCDDGSIWINEARYHYSYDEDGNWLDTGNEYFLRKLSPAGEELASIDLGQFASGEDYFYINSIAADRDGNLYVATDSAVFVLNGDGSPQSKIPTGSYGMGGFYHAADGSLLVENWTDEGTVLQPIDLASKSFGTAVKVPSGYYTVYDGAGEYDFFVDNGLWFCGMKMDAAEPEKLLNWIDLDINSNNMRTVVPRDDGTFVAVSGTWKDDAYEIELATLTKTDKSTIQEKTVLTLAAVYLDYDIKNQIIEFNKTNDQYRVSVVDYSEFNTDDDYSAGYTKLTTEIISGNVPDIICASSDLPIEIYASKGLLEDLYPFIDADTELGGRAGLTENVLKTFEYDGKLYKVPTSYTILTVIGAPSIVGEKQGWTMDEFTAVMADHPDAEAFSEMTRDNLLLMAYAFGGSKYVDWETGKCSFDSPDFIKLLEYAKTYPAEIDYGEDYEYVSDYEKLARGQAIVSMISLSDFDTFAEYKASLGGSIVFKGFPNDVNNGSVIMELDSGLLMSSTCSDKEGAWQLIRSLLTEEYQQENVWWGFPTNKAVFDQKIEDAMTPEMGYDENGQYVEMPKYSVGWGENEIPVYALKQADVDELVSFMETIDTVFRYDTKIMEIIQDCAAPFFAGQKSAGDTAALIQNRVSLYVNEQR